MKKAKRKKSRSSSKKAKRKGVLRRTGAELKRVAKKAARATGMA